MLKSNKTIKGVLYLIPNQFVYSDGINNYPFNVQKNSLLVRARIFSAESSNWSTDKHPDLTFKFPEYVPFDFLKNKKEGGYIVLPVLNNKIVLHLVQTLFEYRSFGKIEEVINEFRKFDTNHRG